jgi:L,D-peptidoglycan transpeptidase YkuD (ErfK/YbiS/YcfS/YnhG family)
VVLAATFALLAEVGSAHAATSGSDPRAPMGLTNVYGAKQLIVVTSKSSTSSVATLRAFDDVNGVWKQVFGPTRARVGRNGWRAAQRRREGDGTTPEGIYTVGATIYGTAPNPGVAYRFHRLVPGDYWDENPADGRRYNSFQRSANTDCAHNPFGGDTECLWREPTPYAYFAVINFNIPATGPYGSAIFLHVGTADPTAGCVSIAQTTLVRILDWLRPADHPRIVLAGPASLARY